MADFADTNTFTITIDPAAGLEKLYVKTAGGTFELHTPHVKVGGTFQEVDAYVKSGGVWVQVHQK